LSALKKKQKCIWVLKSELTLVEHELPSWSVDHQHSLFPSHTLAEDLVNPICGHFDSFLPCVCPKCHNVWGQVIEPLMAQATSCLDVS
jgi:hypothetical protein